MTDKIKKSILPDIEQIKIQKRIKKDTDKLKALLIYAKYNKICLYLQNRYCLPKYKNYDCVELSDNNNTHLIVPRQLVLKNMLIYPLNEKVNNIENIKGIIYLNGDIGFRHKVVGIFDEYSAMKLLSGNTVLEKQLSLEIENTRDYIYFSKHRPYTDIKKTLEDYKKMYDVYKEIMKEPIPKL